MAVSDLFIRLLILFFPGIICFYIVEALTIHRERKPHEVFLLSFVYGVLCYSAYGLARYIVLIIAASKFTRVGLTLALEQNPNLAVFSILSDSKAQFNYWEITWVTLTSVFVSFFLSLAINKKWLNDIAKKFKVSKKFGDLNVWSYVLNADNVEWATVRDMQNNLMFAGQILAFSDIDETAEIVLSSVIVYDEKSGTELYKADRLYLSRSRDSLIIELPHSPSDKKGARHEKQSTDTTHQRGTHV